MRISLFIVACILFVIASVVILGKADVLIPGLRKIRTEILSKRDLRGVRTVAGIEYLLISVSPWPWPSIPHGRCWPWPWHSSYYRSSWHSGVSGLSFTPGSHGVTPCPPSSMPCRTLPSSPKQRAKRLEKTTGAERRKDTEGCVRGPQEVQLPYLIIYRDTAGVRTHTL